MLTILCLFILLLVGMSITFFFAATGFRRVKDWVLDAISTSSSSSTSISSYETFDGTDLGISFQYPSNWVKLEAGFDPNTLNDFEGVVSFDIVNDPLNQANGLLLVDNGLAAS
jgi:hypothetical protein